MMKSDSFDEVILTQTTPTKSGRHGIEMTIIVDGHDIPQRVWGVEALVLSELLDDIPLYGAARYSPVRFSHPYFRD